MEVRSTTDTYFRWLFLAIVITIISVFLWQIRSVLLYGLAAIILVILVEIPVSYLTRYGMPRVVAIGLTIMMSVFFAVLLAMLVLPTLIEQFVTLGAQITKGVEEIIGFWNRGELQARFPVLKNVDFFDSTGEARIDIETVRNVAQQALDTLSQLSGSVVPFIGGIASTLLNVLVVFFLMLFFLADPETYKNGLVKLVPLWYRHRIEHILSRLNFLLRRWLFTQVFGMFVTGIGTFIGLSLIGLHQAAALAVLTAFASFVPNFGELIAVIVAVAVAAVQVPDRLLLVVLVIYGVSFLQGQVIGPLVASESVKIPPVVILLGQIVVARFFGVLGLIMAVPIMAIVMVLIQEIYIIDILGDRGEVKEEDPTLVTEEQQELVAQPGEKPIPDGI